MVGHFSFVKLNVLRNYKLKIYLEDFILFERKIVGNTIIKAAIEMIKNQY
ncbi:hypothetical protein PESHB4_06850 [Pediococcus ethanolidurans]